MHNGQVGDWSLIRRRVEALIPDEYYKARVGTTDSEAVFLAILGAGGETDPVAATVRTLRRSPTWCARAAPRNRCASPPRIADGENLYAFRYSNNDTPNTLYYREAANNVVDRVRAARHRTRALEGGAAEPPHRRAPARAGGTGALPRAGAGRGGVALRHCEERESATKQSSLSLWLWIASLRSQ